jgi:hypothetical protein
VIRQALMNDKAYLFPSPILLTLTTKQTSEYFFDAESAYTYVTEGAFIARLMRDMGIKLNVWSLEFHRGNVKNNFQHRGYPHWHVMLQLPEGRRRMTLEEIERVRYLWRDKWDIGEIDVESCKKATAHAINYITKYMMKRDGAVPDWFLRRCGARLFQASRGVGALIYRGRIEVQSEDDEESDDEEQVKRIRRPMVVRIEECGTKCVVLERKISPDTGVCGWRFVRELNVCYTDLLRLSCMGVLKEVSVIKENKTMCSGTYDVLYWKASHRKYGRLERKFSKLFGDALANRREQIERSAAERAYAMEALAS